MEAGSGQFLLFWAYPLFLTFCTGSGAIDNGLVKSLLANQF